ncbi:MAG: helix-turn-helix transcriptional regulator [Clostridia bacterium]|nr:helix-turn-helix transcriptional regulator [Clostridia bacterium]
MENIRVLRKQSGLTMKQLGIELGMAESTVSLYETGKRSPDIQSLIRIADFFDVSLDYLCGRESDNSERTISPQQSKLLSLFDDLNEEGQEKLIDYADDLVSSGKYIKMHSFVMDKEA